MSKPVSYQEFCKRYELDEQEEMSKVEYTEYVDKLSLFVHEVAISEGLKALAEDAAPLVAKHGKNVVIDVFKEKLDKVLTEQAHGSEPAEHDEH